jgi:hypothetical protein
VGGSLDFQGGNSLDLQGFSRLGRLAPALLKNLLEIRLTVGLIPLDSPPVSRINKKTTQTN